MSTFRSRRRRRGNFERSYDACSQQRVEPCSDGGSGALQLALPRAISRSHSQRPLIEHHFRCAGDCRAYRSSPGEGDLLFIQRRFADDLREHARDDRLNRDHTGILTRVHRVSAGE